jgi:hypothetical protein
MIALVIFSKAYSMNRIKVFAVCTVLMCIAINASAQDDDSSMTSFHNASEDSLFSLTDDIDNFFGDLRTDEQKRKDWFRLGTDVRFKAGEPARLRFNLRAALDLRGYAKNLRFFVTSRSGDRFENGKTLEDSIESQDFVADYKGDEAQAGFTYDFYKSEKMLISLDTGARFRGGPEPFTRFRASRWIDLGSNWSFEPTQFLQWYQDDGFGEKTRIDIDNKVSGTERFRARTEVLRSEGSRGFDFLEDLSFIQKFTDRAYAGVGLSMTAFTDPSWTPDEYAVSLRYRQLISGDWLYLETIPAIGFPNDRDYRATPQITFKFDIYFDRKK